MTACCSGESFLSPIWLPNFCTRWRCWPPRLVHCSSPLILPISTLNFVSLAGVRTLSHSPLLRTTIISNELDLMTHLDAGHPKCASIKLSNIIRWLNYREACAPKFVMCGNSGVITMQRTWKVTDCLVMLMDPFLLDRTPVLLPAINRDVRSLFE